MRLAHIRDDEEQSVYTHLKNVAEYCGIYGGKIGIKSCAELAGWLHDIGKLTDEFEIYIRKSSKLKDKHLKGPDHSTAGAVWVMSIVNKELKGRERQLAQFTSQLIAITIMSHHGGLVDIFNSKGESPYLRRLDKLNNDVAWQETYRQILKEMEMTLDIAYLRQLYIQAVEEISTVFNQLQVKSGDIKELRYASGVLCKYLYSCLIDADRYDTATFMDGVKMTPPRSNDELWKELVERFESKIKGFAADTEINKLRHKISESCYANALNEEGVYTLNCPTGSGKTMASLRFALHHAKNQHKDRIFYIIPFITITEQNAAEIRKILSFTEDDELIRDCVLELHSAKEEEIENNQERVQAAELLAERMAHPMIFTTMVRFLNTFFESGTRNIRGAHQFSNSIIIFDEIQTISPKCIALFNGIINFLTNVCHTTVVLSTATQPLLNRTPETIPNLLMQEVSEISGCTSDMYELFKRTEIVDKTKLGGNTKEDLSQMIWEHVKTKGNALVVLNTKSAVASLYEEMKRQYGEQAEEEKITFYVLSTNLYANHRKKRIEEIRCKLSNKERIIVLSTQLIEAGVDLSFNTVFRSLAGLDSIIQCAGRCNRHGENGFGVYGQVYLINPNFETLGSLKDIKKGRESVESLLEIYNRNKNSFEGGLSSVKAIEAYFTSYYKKQEENMTYKFKECTREFEMYNLLSDNAIIKKESEQNLNIEKNTRTIINQSFKTAAKYFEAIDTKGKSVIIQHGGGKQLVSELLSANRYVDKYKLLNKLQPYTVNISEGVFKKLGNAIRYYEAFGVYILNEDYYDEVFGVSTTPVAMTFYNF